MPLQGTANAGDQSRLVEEAPAVAITFHLSQSVPLPNHDEVRALAVAGSYLTRAGTQVASRLLGCPEPDREAVMLADLSDTLLGSAALCSGLLDLADDEPRR